MKASLSRRLSENSSSLGENSRLREHVPDEFLQVTGGEPLSASLTRSTNFPGVIPLADCYVSH